MKKLTTLKIDDKIVNQYLSFKNLKVNRKYSSNKKVIKKIDHYIWWFKNQKKRESFLIFEDKKLIFISTADHFKFKNYNFIHSGLISCLPETNLFDLLKAIKIQNIYLDKQKNKHCFISFDKKSKVLTRHWKYFGYTLLESNNIFYKYVKKLLKIRNNYEIAYKKII